MKKSLVAYGAAFLLFVAGALFAPLPKLGGQSVYTVLYSQWIQNSLIDSTAIGSTTPSTGAFTALNASTLQIGGTAPNGHLLIGNGTHYVDGVLPVSQTAGLAGSRGFYATTNPDTTPPVAPYIYQNTNTFPLIVTVSGDSGGSGFHGDVYCDSAASPTTLVAEFSRVNAGSSTPNFYPGSVTFVVAPGYYYGISVTSGGGTAFVTNWTEWTL